MAAHLINPKDWPLERDDPGSTVITELPTMAGEFIKFLCQVLAQTLNQAGYEVIERERLRRAGEDWAMHPDCEPCGVASVPMRTQDGRMTTLRQFQFVLQSSDENTRACLCKPVFNIATLLASDQRVQLAVIGTAISEVIEEFHKVNKKEEPGHGITRRFDA